MSGLNHAFERGSSLIEVLVAMLVLTIGLLGYAGLQTQAMRFNYEALQRARASALAEDILDRMRANPQQALASQNYLRQFGDEVPRVDVTCRQRACTATQLAAWDMHHWLTTLQRQMPGADAAIVREQQRITVTVRLLEAGHAGLINAHADTLSEDARSSLSKTDFTFVALL